MSTQRKRGGRPRRPVATLSGVVSNLHLLLTVPSFRRWPLRVHFFDRGVFGAWERWCATPAAVEAASGTGPAGGTREKREVEVLTDFAPAVAATAAAATAPKARKRGRPRSKTREGSTSSDGEEEQEHKWGIHALNVDYAPMKDYVAKGREVFEFERAGDCVVCGEGIVCDDGDNSSQGFHALCPNEGCEAVGHLGCWSRHMLKGDGGDGGQPQRMDAILPVGGRCPRCHGRVRWVDMMRELTLRVRGEKEMEKLLKVKKSKPPAAVVSKGKGKGKRKAEGEVTEEAKVKEREKEKGKELPVKKTRGRPKKVH